jgi:hypothetical protein
MNDPEYDRLHDAFDAFFPGKVRGCRNGKRETIVVPDFRKEGRIARKDAMKILRDHLARPAARQLPRLRDREPRILYDEPRAVGEGARRNLPDRGALPPLPGEAAHAAAAVRGRLFERDREGGFPIL